MVAMFTDTIV